MALSLQFKKQYDESSRLQFVAQYAEDAVETVAQADNFDSAIGSATVTDALTSTPAVTILPDDQSDVPDWLNVYVRISGVNGKTPTFSLDFSNFRSQNRAPDNIEWGMLWRYVDDATVPAGGRPRAWSRFANNSGTTTHTFSNSSAFAQDAIEIAVKPRWRYLDTQRAFDYVESTGLAVELPSSIAASSLPTHVHAQFTHAGTTENTAPVVPINMYGCGVDDTSVQPDSGDKLNVVLIIGQHASEDQGNDSGWETVYFYTDGTGTVADRFRKECRLYVYDANPQGRYYGKERHTDETVDDEDSNRAWDDSGSTQINAVKSAIAADVSRTDILWDWHGHFGLNGNGIAAEYGIYETYATEGLWRSRVNTLLSPLSVTDLGNAPVGCAQDYGNSDLSAQLSSTLEFAVASPGYPDPQATYEPVATAYVEAVQGMVDAGEITLSSSFTLPAIAATTQGQQSESVSLIQNYTVGIVDSIQTQNSESLDLSNTVLLAGLGDSAQSQQSENFALTQHYILNIENSFQNQISGAYTSQSSALLNPIVDSRQLQITGTFSLYGSDISPDIFANIITVKLDDPVYKVAIQ